MVSIVCFSSTCLFFVCVCYSQVINLLISPGIHWLQDPRSKVYNFPPYLEVIPKVTDFAFERLGSFIKSSRDNVLGLSLAGYVYTLNDLHTGLVGTCAEGETDVCGVNVFAFGNAFSCIFPTFW